MIDSIMYFDDKDVFCIQANQAVCTTCSWTLHDPQKSIKTFLGVMNRSLGITALVHHNCVNHNNNARYAYTYHKYRKNINLHKIKTHKSA